VGGSWYDRSQHYSTSKTVNSQAKIFKTNDMKPKRTHKKKEINEGKMQIASVTRKKITNKSPNNQSTLRQLTVNLTTTTVVLIVLRKRNSFRAYVNRQETRWAMPVLSHTNCAA